MVILYGTLEFDGRVRRMLEIFNQLGEVLLVDAAAGDASTSRSTLGAGLSRYNVRLPKAFGRMVEHFWLWQAALRSARAFRPEVVVAEDYFAALPAWLIAKLTSARVVYDAHELIIPCDDMRMSRRDAFWYRLESWIVGRADLVIAANPQRARLMQEHYRLDSMPTYLRNIPRPTDLSAGTRAVLERYPALKRRDSEDRIVIYQGDVRLARGLGRFVEAMSQLPSSHRLIIAGIGPDLDRVKVMAEPYVREGRVAFLGRVPNELLPLVAACADAGIVTYPFVGLNNIYCAPNKLFEYAQAGLPVIATNQPPLADMVGRYRIGALVSRDAGAEEIARTVQEVVAAKRDYQTRLPDFLRDHRWEDEAARVTQRIAELA